MSEAISPAIEHGLSSTEEPEIIRELLGEERLQRISYLYEMMEKAEVQSRSDDPFLATTGLSWKSNLLTADEKNLLRKPSAAGNNSVDRHAARTLKRLPRGGYKTLVSQYRGWAKLAKVDIDVSMRSLPRTPPAPQEMLKIAESTWQKLRDINSRRLLSSQSLAMIKKLGEISNAGPDIYKGLEQAVSNTRTHGGTVTERLRLICKFARDQFGEQLLGELEQTKEHIDGKDLAPDQRLILEDYLAVMAESVQKSIADIEEYTADIPDWGEKIAAMRRTISELMERPLRTALEQRATQERELIINNLSRDLDFVAKTIAGGHRFKSKTHDLGQLSRNLHNFNRELSDDKKIFTVEARGLIVLALEDKLSELFRASDKLADSDLPEPVRQQLFRNNPGALNKVCSWDIPAALRSLRNHLQDPEITRDLGAVIDSTRLQIICRNLEAALEAEDNQD